MEQKSGCGPVGTAHLASCTCTPCMILLALDVTSGRLIDTLHETHHHDAARQLNHALLHIEQAQALSVDED